VPIITGVGHETDFTIADFVSDLRAPTPTAAAELATPNQADMRDNLATLNEQLYRFMQTFHYQLKWTLKELENRLERTSPLNRIQSDKQRVDELDHRLGATIQHRLQLARTQVTGLLQRMASLSPSAVLERGYAIVTNGSGQTISSVDQVRIGEALNVQVSDGDFGVQVENS